jgi:hypothetical protein
MEATPIFPSYSGKHKQDLQIEVEEKKDESLIWE